MDWTSLSQTQRDRIVLSSVDLIKTLSDTLPGDDTALKLWESISQSMGDEARADIFFGLFSDRYLGTIKIWQVPSDRTMSFAKIVKQYTAMNVSEIKELINKAAGVWDPKTEMRMPIERGAYIRISVAPEDRRKCCDELRRIGVMIT